MINLNTNLPSLIAQNSLKASTNKLNQAIERMSTGFKINHASDNAANYSISTNMTTKIGAYQVAEDNAAMGLDLLTTADESLSLIGDKLARLRALQEQASNGTYGEQSLRAINKEVNSIIDEINRIYSTAEYNGIKLFNGYDNSSGSTSGPGFISDVPERDTSTMTALSTVDETQRLSAGTYSISSAEELQKLATITNAGLLDPGSEFVLANDINLAGISWTSIGKVVIDDASGDLDTTYAFKGTFDGNGHVIKNLTQSLILPSDTMMIDSCGLFGVINNAEIKNLGIEEANLRTTGGYTVAGPLGGVVFDNTDIYNVYASGTVKAEYMGGGLLGVVMSNIGSVTITDTKSSVDIICKDDGYHYNFLGGLASGTTAYGSGSITVNGFEYSGSISGPGCYAVGGVASQAQGGTYTNCKITSPSLNSTGDVSPGLFFATAEGITLKDSQYTPNAFLPITGIESDTNTISNVTQIGAENIGKFYSAMTQVDTNSMRSFSTANSTSEITSGTYKISTASELAKLAEMTNNGLIKGGEFVLANDIDLSGYSNWTPIGYYMDSSGSWEDNKAFTGTFNGNGYVIKGLKISDDTHKYLGLFGAINNATIMNLGVENANISAGENNSAGILVGGLAVANSFTSASNISNCYTTGTLNGAVYSGGIVGIVLGNFLKITDSYSEANITSSSDSNWSDCCAGGLLGITGYGSANIKNCYSTGNVKNINTNTNGGRYAGGIVGNIILVKEEADIGTTAIKNSFSVGKVSGGAAGAFAGSINGYNGCLSNCYYNATDNPGLPDIHTTTGFSTGSGISGKTKAELLAMIPDYASRPSSGGTSGGSSGGGTIPGNPGGDIGGSTGNGGYKSIADIEFQVGISASDSSRIGLNTGFELPDIESLRNIGLDNTDYLRKIDSIIATVAAKQTEFGAAQNRLESALEEISTQYENLASSRSTLRDADISEVSSEYIRQQILQEASATLLATANQSPVLALQLL